MKMLTYQEYEKAVFDWLMAKNQNDPTFTFSLRQNGSKGAELDYFIGTEASKYFGTTFWTIPVYYPGSSADMINLFFGFSKNSDLWYSFEVTQTRKPEEEQNIAALSLAKKLKSRFKIAFPTYEESGETNKMEWCKIRPRKPEYKNIEDIFIDVEQDLDIFILIVNEELAKVKSEFPSFTGHKITGEEFNSFKEKKDRRIQKYGNPNPPKPTPPVGSSPVIPVNPSIDVNQPLNQILYGPPGTGKTYSTIELAYRAIKGDSSFEQDGYDVAKQWFKTELVKIEDRQLDFITFHQNYSYEDFVMGIKPDLNEGDGLSFKKHEGIFYKICQRALENLKQSSEEGSAVEPTFYAVFDDFIRPLAEENIPIVVPMKSTNFSFKLTNINEKSIGFEKQSGGTNHTLSIKTIQELYEGNREYNLQGLGVYYNPLMETLKALAKKKTKIIKSVSLKNYVIIIDEINRANISRVFGELITLIEEDKRWGNDHAMEVRLPDGYTPFTVPKNLYIVGTMNTADKSIALLDIALRRRFEFSALYPDSSKVTTKYRTFFEALNEQIIAKKGIDFTIGHSYFMTKDGEELNFVNAMNKKVIPLLNEYFYNAKSNKVVTELVEKAIAKAELSNTIIPNDFQLLIQ